MRVWWRSASQLAERQPDEAPDRNINLILFHRLINDGGESLLRTRVFFSGRRSGESFLERHIRSVFSLILTMVRIGMAGPLQVGTQPLPDSATLPDTNVIKTIARTFSQYTARHCDPFLPPHLQRNKVKNTGEVIAYLNDALQAVPIQLPPDPPFLNLSPVDQPDDNSNGDDLLLQRLVDNSQLLGSASGGGTVDQQDNSHLDDEIQILPDYIFDVSVYMASFDTQMP